MTELLILAQAADPAPTGGSGWFLIFMLVAMWAVLFLPRRMARKRQQEMLMRLEVGDFVITVGGIFGRVVAIEDDAVVLEIEEGRIRVAQRAIGSVRGVVN